MSTSPRRQEVVAAATNRFSINWILDPTYYSLQNPSSLLSLHKSPQEPFSDPKMPPRKVSKTTRFGSVAARERYEKVGKTKNFIRERGIDFGGCQDTATALGWGQFIKEPASPYASTSLVLEFYANLPDITDGTVYCRDQRVPVSAAAINAFYGLPDVDDTAYQALSTDADYDVILACIAKPGTAWSFSIKQARTLPGNCLTVEARVWQYFILARLIPASHYSTVEATRAKLIFAIMQRMPLNVGRIIMAAMTHLNQPVRSSYPFPHLITQLCVRAGVIIAADEPTIGLEPIINEAYVNRFFAKNKIDTVPFSATAPDPSGAGPSSSSAAAPVPQTSAPPPSITTKEQLNQITKKLEEFQQHHKNLDDEMANIRTVQNDIKGRFTTLTTNLKSIFNLQKAICQNLEIPVSHIQWQDPDDTIEFSDLFTEDFDFPHQ